MLHDFLGIGDEGLPAVSQEPGQVGEGCGEDDAQGVVVHHLYAVLIHYR